MSTTHIERLQAELAEITQPLVSHYNELDATIKTMEHEIIDLRKARTQLRTTIRSIDPDLIPVAQSNGKKKLDVRALNVARERLDDLTAWLHERKEELNANGGFHVSGLERNYDNLPSHSATLSAAIRVLHEEGILRLDHSGNGGAKFYKVV